MEVADAFVEKHIFILARIASISALIRNWLILDSTQYSGQSSKKSYIKTKYKLLLKKKRFLILLAAVTLPFFAHAGPLSFLDRIFDPTQAEPFVEQEFAAHNMPLLHSPYTPDSKQGEGGGEITVVGGSALLPVAGPLGSLADIEAEDNKSVSVALYVVREGDTLSDIARMFNVTVNTIVWANTISRANVIRPGQVLVILPVSGVRYTVKKGDTVRSIAKQFKGDVDEIIAYNTLSDGILTEGQTILIPNGEVAPPPFSASKDRAVRGSGPEYAGYYFRPIAGGKKSQGLHGYNGVDLASYCGAPVFASAQGNVIISRLSGWNGGYGVYAVISHPNKTQTLYAHLSSIIVPAGTYVQQGQIIGYVGSTGLSTGCHVHFEIRGAKNPF